MAKSNASDKVSGACRDFGRGAIQNALMANSTPARWYLKAWRRFRGLTQDELGAVVDLSTPYISQLESGKRQYTEELLTAFAEALDCDVIDLITRDPQDPEGIWTVWEALDPGDRRRLVEMGRSLRDLAKID